MRTNQNEIPFLHEKYTRLLEKQQFNEKNLDYTILDRHLPVLQKLAETSNSLVTVFDLFQKRHVFHSALSESFMGYSKTEFEEGGDYFLDAKTHPEDYATLLKNGITLFKVLTGLPLERKLNCKLTKREIEILKHIREGKLSKEISDQLFISVHTVNTHRQKVLGKLNAGNSIEAIIIASRLGLI